MTSTFSGMLLSYMQYVNTVCSRTTLCCLHANVHSFIQLCYCAGPN